MSQSQEKTSQSLVSPTRRNFILSSAAGTAGLLSQPEISFAAEDSKQSSSDPTQIGTRRELFIDRALIEALDGEAQQRLHHPIPQEIAIEHTDSWEGTGCGYHSVFRDGDRYRMYYIGWDIKLGKGNLDAGGHPYYLCYAESEDGIAWRKPALNLHEHEGSTKNNILLKTGRQGPIDVDAGHSTFFRDENPDAPEDAKYKAIFRSREPNGLLPFKSADGVHWTPMTEKPILYGQGSYDSQNLVFWDSTIQKYRAYWRIFTIGITVPKKGSVRAIRTAVSDDLIHWSSAKDLTYEDSPPEELYTNQIKPYPRAPHLLIGFPTRYIDRGWSKSMEALPDPEDRKLRSSVSPRYGTAISEGLLMVSRDGTHFKRWNEAFLRPGIQRPDTWNYGHNFIAWHVAETQSSLRGAAPELSLYAVEGYWHGEGTALRRYTLRLDGFVSVNASMSGGELVTKPIIMDGNSLDLNFSTSAAGLVRVELQKADGSAIEGFSLSDCDELFGDTVSRQVTWQGKKDVSQLAGQPIRIRFAMKDADLYSYRFKA